MLLLSFLHLSPIHKYTNLWICTSLPDAVRHISPGLQSAELKHTAIMPAVKARLAAWKLRSLSRCAAFTSNQK